MAQLSIDRALKKHTKEKLDLPGFKHIDITIGCETLDKSLNLTNSFFPTEKWRTEHSARPIKTYKLFFMVNLVP